jgi:hypothetical protein
MSAGMYDRLRPAVPGLVFHPPASEQQIARVERGLGMVFPGWLRELYLQSNGIFSNRGDAYLYPLEKSDDVPNGLLDWNHFLRDQWELVAKDFQRDFPEIDWERLHVANLLVIGGFNGTDWAIDPQAGPAIIWYDVRDPESREVLAGDLVDMCVKQEAEQAAIHSLLFRGRKPLPQEDDELPATTDVAWLRDTLIELYRGGRGLGASSRCATSPGWSLYQAISSRPGEEGMLFVLSRGSFEIQIATRDGNLFFVMRAKVAFQEEPLRCLVKEIPEAVLCVLHLMDLRPWDARADEDARRAAAASAAEVWRHRYGPLEEKLERMADVLFGRDDRRLEEENAMGE